MRVLHLGKFYPPYAGGIEQFLGDLLPALRNEGIEPAALVHAHAVGQKIPKPFPVWQVPTHGNLLYAPISPAFPLWLSRMIATFRPNVLHLHLPNLSAFWALVVPAASQLPWVIHWHADVVPSRIDRRLGLAYQAYRPFERKVLQRSSRIIATSPAYRDHSPALKPFLHKVEVVPLGLDPSRLPPPTPEKKRWADELWGEGNHLRLLCIGRMTYYKGHRVLIEALSQVRGVRLLCVGGGELAGWLGSMVRQSGQADKVRLLGSLSDTDRNALLATCNTLVLPSVERTEAFGLVLLEAMAYGKPVIATRVEGAGMGWVVNESGGGWLVPAGDTVALARCIETVQQCLDLKGGARETMRWQLPQTFHIQSCARQLASIYRAIGQID